MSPGLRKTCVWRARKDDFEACFCGLCEKSTQNQLFLVASFSAKYQNPASPAPAGFFFASPSEPLQMRALSRSFVFVSVYSAFCGARSRYKIFFVPVCGLPLGPETSTGPGPKKQGEQMAKEEKRRVADNLYIVTKPSGNSYYLVRFMLDGKSMQKTLGRADDMTLRQAKARGAQAIEDVRTKARESVERQQRAPLFRDCARDALRDIEAVKRWRNPRSVAQWSASLNAAMPQLGNITVDRISRDDVLRVLRPIWVTKTESAHRLQQRLAAVFDWAIVKGFMLNNPAAWKSNLEFFLPAPGKVKTEKHHDAPTIAELHKVVTYCREHPSPVSGLLLFTIATVCRVSEARQATHDQIDRTAGIWTVPIEAQKCATGARRVPLNTLAREALKQASGEGYLFPGMRGMIALDSARLKMNEILGRNTTVHGIRSTFRDWAAREGADRDTAELCLSHVVGSKVERAYLRDDLLQKRKKLLEKWCDCVRV